MLDLNSIARAAILRSLPILKEGQLIIRDHDQTLTFGRLTDACPLQATMTIHDRELYRKLLFGGSVAMGETFSEGLWTCDDLTALLRIGSQNKDLLASLGKSWAWISKPVRRFVHWLHSNTLMGSRRNISAHYDLGNDFFQAFLDETMMYSCALFDDSATSLGDASVAKNDLVCRKLRLSPNDHLLEIGGGWGGFAIYAAARYGCKVTTTTISKRQYELAVQRVQDAGLEGQIVVLCEDYRNLTGRYSKLVSIEMIEAVGESYFDTYFGCCDRLLEPEGAMLLQAITIADQHYPTYRRSVDFIQKHIFPGGLLPSISVICNSVARATNLRVTHLEAITPHYAVTVSRWRDRLLSQKGALAQRGYSEKLLRLWEYYFSYCEAGFHERKVGVVQLLLAKPRCRAARAPMAVYNEC